MEIVVHCRSAGKRAFLEASAKFFAQELKIDRSRWTLNIYTKKGIKKNEDIKGAVMHTSTKQLTMILDSQLEWETMINTLAHEMVHVKQFVRNQVRIDDRRKKSVYYWKGQKVVADYFNQPWEIEAWSKERLLASRLYAIISEM
jgi:chromosome condensin MukBEF complex kleisin-like MukF subunit